MGVYKRKKQGKYYGPYIVKYPVRRDTRTRKIIYTTCTAGDYKAAADDIFRQRMDDWKRKLHLGIQYDRDITFATLAEWYQKHPSLNQLRTRGKILAHCKKLQEHFGQMRAWEIKATDVEQYRLKRLSEFSNHKTTYRPASINREIEILKRMFNLAMRDGLVQHNPCWKVKRLSEDNVRKRVLSQEELKKLIAELPPHAADLVVVGYWTGMRLGEILQLTWDRVNLKECYFRLTEADTKTREPRDVYFPGPVRQILERIRKGKLSNIAYVFTYKGLPIKNIKTALTRAAQKAQIEDFHFHDLRHTYVTNARRAGVDQTVIMKLTGHKTLSMFARYDSVQPRDAQDALKKLDALLKDEEDDAAAILLQ